VGHTTLASFTTYASHHQFTVTDDDPSVFGDPDGWADSEALKRQLVQTCPGQLAVGTTSYGDVRVEIALSDSPLDSDSIAQGWQHVVEASLTTTTGRLVIESVADAGLPSAPRVSVAPGTYRVRVMRRGLETVDPSTQEGQEECRLVLWRAPAAAPRLLREHQNSRF
jgi:hypothetical protein